MQHVHMYLLESDNNKGRNLNKETNKDANN